MTPALIIEHNAKDAVRATKPVELVGERCSALDDLYTLDPTWCEHPGCWPYRSIADEAIAGSLLEAVFLGFAYRHSCPQPNADGISLRGGWYKELTSTAFMRGGALTLIGANITVSYSHFQSCVATRSAVSRRNLFSHYRLYRDRLSEGQSYDFAKALGSGGAILMEQLSYAEVVDTEFLHNKANQGGAIFLDMSELNVASSTFKSNAADARGGAVHDQELHQGQDRGGRGQTVC